MANTEHAARLRQGRASWNHWRWEFPDVPVDLNNADLSGANLSRTNLYGADLREANLSGADLREADLSGAWLMEARMLGANLEQVLMNGANFQGADLRGIPWLLVMDLTLQSGVNFVGIQWDCPIDDAALLDE